MQVVRDGKAERTKIVQNAFKTMKGVEEALLRPASKGARLVNETGFSTDRDLRRNYTRTRRRRSPKMKLIHS